MSSCATERLNRIVRHIEPSFVGAEQKGKVYIEGVMNGVAVIVINNPPANSLSNEVAAALRECYEAAMQNDEVKAMVLTSKSRFFMAGADIVMLAGLQALSEDMRAQKLKMLSTNNRLMYNIESGSKPVVAAIPGPALGGGLELAMACAARVSLAKGPVFGLPEVKIGLFPGMGGTQRFPRLIGVQKCLKYMLTGKNIKPKDALKFGLVDQLVKKPNELLPAALKLALAIAAGQAPRKEALKMTSKLKSLEEDLLAIQGARVMTRGKTKLPHPFAMLDAVEVGVRDGVRKGLDREAKNFGMIVPTPSAKGLVHTFLASKACWKVPGLPKRGGRVQTVAVLGGGTMGSGIIIALLMNGYNVILKEINQRFLEGGIRRIISNVNRVIRKRKMDPMALEYIMRNLQSTITYDDFKSVDMVIEAAVENVPIKQKIFKELVAVTRDDCVLATNTSTINIDLCSELVPEARGRIVGFHFFSPAHVMPLLEIIRTTTTSPLTIRTSLDMAKRIKKTPVVVGNCTGFTANRVFFPYGMAAGLLVDLQVSPYEIDQALEGFGMPMGVFRMSDQVGLDIGVHVSKNVSESYGERTYISSFVSRLMDAKRLGQKTGSGVYKYVKNRPVPDPDAVMAFAQAAAGDAKLQGPLSPALGAKEMVEILLFPCVNESFRVIGEKQVIRDSDIDIASIMGYGFPAHLGGLVFWGRSQGLPYVVNRLTYYSKFFGKMDPQCAGFFAPCAHLVAEADK